MMVSRKYIIMKKLEMISIRLPVDLLTQLDKIKENEGIDRTALIIRALKYWVSVNGRITTDNELLTRLDKIETEMSIISEKIRSETDLRKQINQHEQVIDALLKRI